jgi:hypothetical protein
VIIVIASITAIIDPFCHYHMPLLGISVSMNQSYLNPGLVSHFKYDSLITGTSMTENFRPSYFKKMLGVDAIKVPYSGGTAKNMRIILERALRKNPKLKTVYLGLDLPILKKDHEKTITPLPDYLYDSNPFSDFKYLLNKDILIKIDSYFMDGYNILTAIKGGVSTAFDFDDYSSWNNRFTFSQNATMESYFHEVKTSIQPLSSDNSIKSVQNNLRINIAPLIESHPNTDFVIFFPPYSILYWYSNNVENDLAILELSIKTLLSYDNVKLFLFQNAHDIVTNLYNYKDYTHYSVDINNYVVDCFQNGKHRITAQNYVDELAKLKDMAANFDYGILFGESNPFIVENDFGEYLTKLSNHRYIAFIVARADSPITAKETFDNYNVAGGLWNDKSRSGLGYAAVYNGDSVLFLESHDEAILFNGKIHGLHVNMVSEKRSGVNYVEVVVNGVKYTTNQEGLNIVVYDTELLRVMDNIAINLNDNKISRR